MYALHLETSLNVVGILMLSLNCHFKPVRPQTFRKD